MTIDVNQATSLNRPRPVATLVIKQGPQIGIIFPVTANRVVMGREEGNQIVIHDAEVSRRHCELTWNGAAYILQDVGSTNGVFVNGVQLTAPISLRSGDTIGVGQTVMVLEFDIDGPSAQADYERPAASFAGTLPPENPSPTKFGNPKTWLLIGCGCLFLLCACSIIGMLGLDLFDFLNLGIPGFSQINLP